MQFTSIDGIVLHFKRSGTAENVPLLIFVNSLGCDLRIWDQVCTYLEDSIEILRYDKRGHGLSETGVVPYSIEDHVKDLEGLIQEFGEGRKIFVCGLSIGGLIVQGLIQRKKRKVTGIILSDTGSKIGSTERYNERIKSVTEHGMNPFAIKQIPRWFSQEFIKKSSETVLGMYNMLCRQPIDGYTASCVAIRDADYSEAVSEIDVPVLCLVGSEDASTKPEQMKALASSINGSAYDEIEGAGHLPCIEKPKAMARCIRDFIVATLTNTST